MAVPENHQSIANKVYSAVGADTIDNPKYFGIHDGNRPNLRETGATFIGAIKDGIDWLRGDERLILPGLIKSMKFQFNGQKKGAQENDLEAIERKIGVLPKDYREFLRETNGGACQLNFRNDDFHFDVHLFYSIDELVSKVDLFDEQLNTFSYLPIASTSAGDLVCIDKTRGPVCFWDHEISLPNEVEFLADCFQGFWSQLTEREWPSEYDLSNVENLPKNWRSEKGRLICECAAIEGHSEIVSKCLSEGYPIGDAIHYAAMNGKMNIVDLLLEGGVGINAVDSEGKTPLDWASWKQSFCDLLSERGALSGRDAKK